MAHKYLLLFCPFSAQLKYTLKNPKNSIFIFVIEGIFEVQNRLLHARDGLSLTDIDTVELEALSNDAVILLLELPLGSSAV